MTLSSESKKRFRAIGHNLKPIVTIAGNGLTQSVNAELDRSLDDHELVKVKVAMEDRDERRSIIESICRSRRAELVQVIGKVALLYRENKKPKLSTSNTR